MNHRHFLLSIAAACVAFAGCAKTNAAEASEPSAESTPATVYMTTEISPKKLIEIYEALGPLKGILL